MEFRPRSTSSLAAVVLAGLLLLAANRSPAQAAALSPADFSGEELDDTPPPEHLSLALLIQIEAAALKVELCNRYTVCDNSMEVLLQNNLDLPKIREEDGCFRSAFKREKCLKKISSGLKEFKKYLVAVERTFATEGELSVSLQRKTEYLAVMVKLQMKNPSSVPVTDEEAFTNYFLPKNPWLKKVVTRLILRDFTLFIEKTIRAIRFLSTRRNLDI